MATSRSCDDPRHRELQRPPHLLVLGPTTLLGVELTGQQAKVLAALAHRPGRACPRERLIDHLWGESTPNSARQSLQNQMTRLRRRVGMPLVETTACGYRLAPMVTTDADRLTETARRHLGSAPSADLIGELRTVLAEWRGRPFAELDDDNEVEATRVQLFELRAATSELLAESLIAGGELQAGVIELKSLVEHEPYRDRPWEVLMVTLARLGRRTEAVAVYRSHHDKVRTDLGISPSRHLTELSTAIEHEKPVLVSPRPRHLHAVAPLHTEMSRLG